MLCRQCGSNLQEGTTFCPDCGAKQDVAAPNYQQQTYAQPQYQQPNYQQQAYAQPQYQQPSYQQPVMNQANVPSNGSVSFGAAIKLYFTNYANFKGRATRSEFWWAYLFTFLATFVLAFIPVIGWLAMLALIVPNLAIMVRRLHDTGKPWPYILLSLVPFAGGIIMIVFCCQDSVGDNQWGRGPVRVYR